MMMMMGSRTRALSRVFQGAKSSGEGHPPVEGVMKRFRLFPVLVCCLAGCVPVDLEVNRKGEMIIPREDGFFRYQPGTRQVTQVEGGPAGQPGFARFAPSGTDVLLVVKGRDERKFEDY